MQTWLVTCTTRAGDVPCGTTHQTLVHLKTEKGVLKRVAGFKWWPDNSGEVTIQTYDRVKGKGYGVKATFQNMGVLRAVACGKL